MKVLVLSQIYWPDTSSVAQHLTDLCETLSMRNISVTVFTGLHDYENPKVLYPKSEVRNNVKIERIRNTGFGKKYILYRLIDFITFNVSLAFKLLQINKYEYDRILGLTVPPLISFFGVIISKFKRSNFIYWVMDLQPELAISVGYIKKNSLSAKLLTRMGDYIYKKADRIISLDMFMSKHIENRGAKIERISTIPVWPVLENEYIGDRITNPFRVLNDFSDKFVIMYSGNHSVVHPLDTLLSAANLLKYDTKIIFVFIGGGIREKDVTNFKNEKQLKNIIQLPYQPRSQIHISLSAADLQVVILGNNQIGYTHPNKIYGAMLVGKPILYIGPAPSHVTNILDNLKGNLSVKHGESELLAKKILNFSELSKSEIESIGYKNKMYINKYYDSKMLLSKMIEKIES